MKDTIIIQDKEYKVITIHRYNTDGVYEPYDIYDAAKRFTSDMYIPNSLMCLSFGIKKNLKLGKGGMILCDKLEVANELKRLRWSGRTEGVSMSEDPVDTMGDNSYITPEWAARGLMLLSVYPQDHPDQLEENGYPDLSQYGFMKKHTTLRTKLSRYTRNTHATRSFDAPPHRPQRASSAPPCESSARRAAAGRWGTAPSPPRSSGTSSRRRAA